MFRASSRQIQWSNLRLYSIFSHIASLLQEIDKALEEADLFEKKFKIEERERRRNQNAMELFDLILKDQTIISFITIILSSILTPQRTVCFHFEGRLIPFFLYIYNTYNFISSYWWTYMFLSVSYMKAPGCGNANWYREAICSPSFYKYTKTFST